MKGVARSLRILWRAESLLATMRLAALTKKAGLLAFAALVGVFGVAMLDLAAFFALVPQWGETRAALAVGLADVVVAIAIVALARSIEPAAEAEMLIEVRDMALADLEAEVAAIEDAVRHARKELEGMVRHPLGTIAPSVLVPLLKSVVGSLRSAKSAD